MTKVATGSFWKTTLTFALVGPPIGGLSVIGWWTYLSFAQSGVIDERALWLVAAGIFYGYVFGLLPAFFTGALGGLASPAVHSNGLWIAASAIIAWLIAVLVLGVNGFLSDSPSGQFWNGLIGAIPGVVCAVLTCRIRPRRS